MASRPRRPNLPDAGPGRLFLPPCFARRRLFQAPEAEFSASGDARHGPPGYADILNLNDGGGPEATPPKWSGR